MNELFTGILITKLPELKDYNDLLMFDIGIGRKHKSFMRPTSVFDLHSDIPSDAKEHIKNSKYCEVQFIEIDGRMSRQQRFYADITLISSLN